jgi:hypothetical protein
VKSTYNRTLWLTTLTIFSTQADDPDHCALPPASAAGALPSARRRVESSEGDRIEYWEESRYARAPSDPSLECGCTFCDECWETRFDSLGDWCADALRRCFTLSLFAICFFVGCTGNLLLFHAPFAFALHFAPFPKRMKAQN